MYTTGTFRGIEMRQKSNIIDEIHQIRQDYAERFNNDLHAICQDAIHKQGSTNRKVIPANPKPIQNSYLNVNIASKAKEEMGSK
jgi:hypothetical protein